MHNTWPPTAKVKVTTLTDWLEAVTHRILCQGHISYKGRAGQIHYKFMIIILSMKVYHVHYLVFYTQGQHHFLAWK